MKYKEKIRLAEKGIEFISKGNSLNDYQKELENDGYNQYIIQNVLSSIKNIESFNKSKKIKELENDENFLERNIKFITEGKTIDELKDELSKNKFTLNEINTIIDNVKKSLYEKSKVQIRELLLDGVALENSELSIWLPPKLLEEFRKREILSIINDSRKDVKKLVFLSVNELEIIELVENNFFPKEEIEKYIIKYKKESNDSSKKSCFQTIIFILGIVLILFGIMVSIYQHRIKFGLILGGIGMVISGYKFLKE